jgi:hypothetical protein
MLMRRRPTGRARFDDEVVAGEIATCAMVKLELLYSARHRRRHHVLRVTRQGAAAGSRHPDGYRVALTSA